MTLVGQYAKVKETEARLSFRLRDCTGELVCHTDAQWSAALPLLQEHAYVRVYASVREDRSLSVQHLRCIDDCNEISFHQIEAASRFLAPRQQSTAAAAEQRACSGNSRLSDFFTPLPSAGAGTFAAHIPSHYQPPQHLAAAAAVQGGRGGAAFSFQATVAATHWPPQQTQQLPLRTLIRHAISTARSEAGASMSDIDTLCPGFNVVEIRPGSGVTHRPLSRACSPPSLPLSALCLCLCSEELKRMGQAGQSNGHRAASARCHQACLKPAPAMLLLLLLSTACLRPALHRGSGRSIQALTASAELLRLCSRCCC